MQPTTTERGQMIAIAALWLAAIGVIIWLAIGIAAGDPRVLGIVGWLASILP